MKFIRELFDPRRKQLKRWTKERLETFIFNETTVEHLHRYAFACAHANDKTILDVANLCGI